MMEIKFFNVKNQLKRMEASFETLINVVCEKANFIVITIFHSHGYSNTVATVHA